MSVITKASMDWRYNIPPVRCSACGECVETSLFYRKENKAFCSVSCAEKMKGAV